MDSPAIFVALAKQLPFSALLRTGIASRGTRAMVDNPTLWNGIATKMGWNRDAADVPLLKGRVISLLACGLGDDQLSLEAQMDAWLQEGDRAPHERGDLTLAVADRARTLLPIASPRYATVLASCVVGSRDPWLLEEFSERGGRIRSLLDLKKGIENQPDTGLLLRVIEGVKPTLALLKSATETGNIQLMGWCIRGKIRPNEAVIEVATLDVLRILARQIKGMVSLFALAAKAGSLPLANLLWQAGARPRLGELTRMATYTKGEQVAVAQWIAHRNARS